MIFASFNTFFLIVEERSEIWQVDAMLVLVTYIGRDERCSPLTGFT